MSLFGLRLVRSGASACLDREAEDRLRRSDRAALRPAVELRRDPHLEMHTRGG